MADRGKKPPDVCPTEAARSVLCTPRIARALYSHSAENHSQSRCRKGFLLIPEPLFRAYPEKVKTPERLYRLIFDFIGYFRSRWRFPAIAAGTAIVAAVATG